MAVKAIVQNNVKSSWVIGKVVFDKKINTGRVYFKRKKLYRGLADSYFQ